MGTDNLTYQEALDALEKGIPPALISRRPWWVAALAAAVAAAVAAWRSFGQADDDEFHRASPVWLSCYEREQCYGGPEEGGWWYDNLTYRGGRWFPNAELADQARERLADWVKARHAEERRAMADADSRLPDEDSPYADCGEGYIPRHYTAGGETLLLIEERPGEHQTMERPSYE